MYLEHIPYSESDTITAGSVIDANVVHGDKSITATFRNRKGIAINDIVRLKQVTYAITALTKVGRTHLKIEAYEA